MPNSNGYYYGEAFNIETGKNEWVGTGTREAILKRGLILGSFIGYDQPNLFPDDWRPQPVNFTPHSN